jgi:hypothetical protein
VRLPPELRLMVYQFALREVTNPTMFPSSGEVQKPQSNRGALALIHTSKFIRDDSYSTMWYKARRHSNNLHGIYMAASERTREVGDLDSFGSPEYKQAQDSFKRVSRQVRCVSLIVDILTKALMAYWNDYIHQEQFEKDIATHDPVVRHEANE